MKPTKRLPLENAYNVRELGGYPASNKKTTKTQAFLRSDDVTYLKESDIDYLLDYGVTSVIDLRSDYELERAPNPFANIDRVQFLHAPLLVIDRDLMRGPEVFIDMFSKAEEGILAQMYVEILKDRKESLRQIFEFIAKQEGCVLFHCTAGKDRTGVLAMLLLGLVEVDRADIIANYMVSEIYNEANSRKQVMNVPLEFPEDLSFSRPQFIARAYDYVVDHYGNIQNYLLSIGLTKEEIQRIKAKLIS